MNPLGRFEALRRNNEQTARRAWLWSHRAVIDDSARRDETSSGKRVARV